MKKHRLGTHLTMIFLQIIQQDQNSWIYKCLMRIQIVTNKMKFNKFQNVMNKLQKKYKKWWNKWVFRMNLVTRMMIMGKKNKTKMRKMRKMSNGMKKERMRWMILMTLMECILIINLLSLIGLRQNNFSWKWRNKRKMIRKIGKVLLKPKVLLILTEIESIWMILMFILKYLRFRSLHLEMTMFMPKKKNPKKKLASKRKLEKMNRLSMK